MHTFFPPLFLNYFLQGSRFHLETLYHQFPDFLCCLSGSLSLPFFPTVKLFLLRSLAMPFIISLGLAGGHRELFFGLTSGNNNPFSSLSFLSPILRLFYYSPTLFLLLRFFMSSLFFLLSLSSFFLFPLLSFSSSSSPVSCQAHPLATSN